MTYCADPHSVVVRKDVVQYSRSKALFPQQIV